MIGLFKDFCKLLIYGIGLYVMINILFFIILMGIMWVSWT